MFVFAPVHPTLVVLAATVAVSVGTLIENVYGLVIFTWRTLVARG